MAAHLRNLPDPLQVALVEPSTKHYYQPLWTLVGAGVMPREESEREEADFMPPGVEWIRDRVATFQPEQNAVTLENGDVLEYEHLVVCPGIKIDWDRVKGLPETLGKNGVCSNYSYDVVEYTWETLRTFKGGRALFTQPVAPVKCGGAPQKILYLASDHFRRRGILEKTDVQFYSPGELVFGVVEFARTLKKVLDRYGITFNFKHDLVEVRGDRKEAVFNVTDAEGNVTQKVEPFDMIHVTPPQSAPDFIRQSPLAAADGFVDVDKHTLQHVRYPNIFALGDASNLPTARTGAAVRKQAPVVVHNLLQHRATGFLEEPKRYDGYTSCPLITGYGRLVLAEFDYDNKPVPSFPFDTTQERYSMYALKLYALPQMYWHGMLKGRV